MGIQHARQIVGREARKTLRLIPRGIEPRLNSIDAEKPAPVKAMWLEHEFRRHVLRREVRVVAATSRQASTVAAERRSSAARCLSKAPSGSSHASTATAAGSSSDRTPNTYVIDPSSCSASPSPIEVDSPAV
mgnify:CR=1 FL=1